MQNCVTKTMPELKFILFYRSQETQSCGSMVILDFLQSNVNSIEIKATLKENQLKYLHSFLRFHFEKRTSLVFEKLISKTIQGWLMALHNFNTTVIHEY